MVSSSVKPDGLRLLARLAASSRNLPSLGPHAPQGRRTPAAGAFIKHQLRLISPPFVTHQGAKSSVQPAPRVPGVRWDPAPAPPRVAGATRWGFGALTWADQSDCPRLIKLFGPPAPETVRREESSGERASAGPESPAQPCAA